MKFTYDKIPLEQIEKWRNDGKQPSGALRRKTLSEVWHVAFKPIEADAKVEFAKVRTEKDAVIPVYRYAASADFNEALMFVLSLGIQVAAELPSRPARVHIVMGDGYTHDEATGAVFLYLGFGFQLEA